MEGCWMNLIFIIFIKEWEKKEETQQAQWSEPLFLSTRILAQHTFFFLYLI
jgi:hypothetical protein